MIKQIVKKFLTLKNAINYIFKTTAKPTNAFEKKNKTSMPSETIEEYKMGKTITDTTAMNVSTMSMSESASLTSFGLLMHLLTIDLA